jgi:hypothetical protein
MRVLAWSLIVLAVLALAVLQLAAWLRDRRVPVPGPDAVTGPGDGEDDDE